MDAINTSLTWFTTVFYGTCIVVTPDFISEILHAPRVDRPNYPSYPRLFSISRDELVTLFCEKRHSSMRRSCCGEVPLISLQLSSLGDHGSLIW